MKKRNTVLAVLLSASFLLTACQNTTEPAAENPAANTNSDTSGFENMKVRKLDGTETDMNSILSNAELTVFNIWEPSCGSCQSEMEALAALGDQYSGRGVQIIGIIKGVTQKRDEEALAVISETGAHYIQLLDSEELEKMMPGLYEETPSTVLYSRNKEQLGTVYAGARDEDYWGKEIEKYHSKVCENDHPADCAVG